MRLRSPLFLGLVLCLTPLTATAQVRLEWKFKEGDQFFQETTTQLKQTTRVAGQETKKEVAHTTVTSFLVEKRNMDGTVVIRMRIEGIKTDNASGAADSEMLLKRMRDVALTLTLGTDGQITKFEGYDDLLNRLSDNDPNTRRVISATLSEETLRRSAEEAFAFLPRKAVARGDRWERKVDISLGPIGSLAAQHSYTYEGPGMLDGRTLQKLSCEASIAYSPPKPDAGTLPFQITRGDLKVNSGKGVLWFDDARGRLAQSQMQVQIKGALAITANGQDFTLELDQDQTVAIRILEKNPLAE